MTSNFINFIRDLNLTAGYGLTLWCALSLLVGGAIQEPQLLTVTVTVKKSIPDLCVSVYWKYKRIQSVIKAPSYTVRRINRPKDKRSARWADGWAGTKHVLRSVAQHLLLTHNHLVPRYPYTFLWPVFMRFAFTTKNVQRESKSRPLKLLRYFLS